MARILVTAPRTLTARRAAAALSQRLAADGHDATVLETPDRSAVHAADALVAVLEGADAGCAATAALAHAARKPVLGLAGPEGAPDWLAALCADVVRADDLEGWLAALPPFYDDVRPFAGRLVRDLVPRLVRDAGYAVTFRTVGPDERPRFLKQKVLEEARALAEGDAGKEREEIADLLEALEALIRARGLERETLKQVKEAKLRRRGGFERGFVVESTAQAGAGSDAAHTPPTPAGPGTARTGAVPAADPGHARPSVGARAAPSDLAAPEPFDLPTFGDGKEAQEEAAEVEDEAEPRGQSGKDRPDAPRRRTTFYEV